MRLKKRLSRLGITIALLMIVSRMVFESSADAPDESKPERKIYLRVTLGKGYEKPVHIHVVTDQLGAPWSVEHYAISKDGVEKGLEPSHRESLLKNGEQTPWCDLTEMLQPEQGTRLVISPAYVYSVNAETFNAVLEFATAPSADAVVKTIHCHHHPSTLNILVPGDLNTPENIARLKTDKEIAEETGTMADTMTWPTIGETPVLFPFFVTSNLQPGKNDQDVLLRELRTLRRFGFNGIGIKTILGGLEWHRFFENFALPKKFLNGNIWYTRGSFSSPDVEKMKEWASIYVQAHQKQGLTPGEITYCSLMDEPVGESPEFLSRDESSITAFRGWLQSLGKTPADLLVNTWEEVRPVTEAERETKPALFYFTQRFRTHALGKFMEVQKEILFDAWQARFPTAANFSDGAIYYANFYGQGVDYFELLYGTHQNSIWGEDWANSSSTFQCGAYNAQLMHAAVRKHGQPLGSYLITSDGRKALDIKLKALGLVSRGVKMLDSFYYGPAWGGHEEGMWIQSPDTWYSITEVVREIGAVEYWLLEAQPKKAETALLYSSASDIWTLNQNHAFGFDRMHIWLALVHAQMPVDIVHETEVAEEFLKDYKVCYLSGPNITSACAEKLKQWVLDGGALVLTPGAASRDEYNRRISTIDQLLPVEREPIRQIQAYNAEGRGLNRLSVLDTVKTSSGSFEVLSVQQTFQSQQLAADHIIGTYADGSPAIIKAKAGRGTVICYGFLPALHYIKYALHHRAGIEKELANSPKDLDQRSSEILPGVDLIEKSYNPWEFPAETRDFITAPVREAHVELPIQCNIPLVDATYLECDRGILIPLANYSLRPIKDLRLAVRVPGKIREVVSVHHGTLAYTFEAPNQICFSLPLTSTDFVRISMDFHQ